MEMFLVLFIFILQPPYVLMCKNTYKQNLKLRGALFTTGILKEYSDATKFQDCIKHCKKQYCLSFSANTQTGLCRLYSKVFYNMHGAISQDGVAYYYQYSKSCLNWRQTCSPHPTGLYTLSRGKSKYNVVCDMDIAGGGWIVMQNRFDGSVSFNRGGFSGTGFGDFGNGEFWSGLGIVKNMCYRPACEAHVELEDWQGVRKFASYSKFRCSWAGWGFPLTISGYSGNAGDAMGNLTGKKFIRCDGYSWWYDDCYQDQSNINGVYTVDNGTAVDNAMTWWTFHGSNRPLKKSRFLASDLGGGTKEEDPGPFVTAESTTSKRFGEIRVALPGPRHSGSTKCDIKCQEEL
ncbi:ficolin-2-like [Argopecten irradians]|uniref:ficolin-2-like n=1 Tax=Argopecten irradians TaxID=31199 RepID=UPI0037123634